MEVYIVMSGQFVPFSSRKVMIRSVFASLEDADRELNSLREENGDHDLYRVEAHNVIPINKNTD